MGIGCAECEQLWKEYQRLRTIHVSLLKGARWGRKHLSEALERAENERQRGRGQLLKHAATHQETGYWHSGPITL